MAQNGHRLKIIEVQTLVCKQYSETPEYHSAVTDLYKSLARGYALLKLTPQQVAAMMGSQHALERIFNLPDDQKLAFAREEDAPVRGYFNLPGKEVYEIALSSSSSHSEAGLQPLLQQVRALGHAAFR